MKFWQVILLAVLLAVMPIVSACGPSKAKLAQEKAYRDQLKALKEQQDAYQKSNTEYQKSLAEGLQRYTEEYAKDKGKKSIYSEESLKWLKLTTEEVGYKRIKE